MNLRPGLTNLWLFLIIGYGIIWAAMIFADRRRRKPIEAPELTDYSGKKASIF